MSILLAGKSDAHFNDCTLNNGTYFALIHNVNGKPEEVGEMEVNNCKIRTGKEIMLCRSENTDIKFFRTEMKSELGVILRSEVNDDPSHTIPSDHPFGIRVEFEECKLEGDIIHEDTERDMFIDLKRVHMTGSIKNAVLNMDVRSCWYATADSYVTLEGLVYLNQIDAPAGVTIYAKGTEAGEYDLLSGGKLSVNGDGSF